MRRAVVEIHATLPVHRQVLRSPSRFILPFEATIERGEPIEHFLAVLVSAIVGNGSFDDVVTITEKVISPVVVHGV